eukprot:Partr_v1_DN28917_c0_g1_i2_m25279 putative ATP-binding cassette, sub-family C (CFTR MRP), member
MPSTNPSDSKQKGMEPILLKGSFFLSDWLFAYVYEIGYYCRKLPAKALRFRLREFDSAAFNADKIDAAWSAEQKANPSQPSVFRALWKAYGLNYMLIGLYKLVWGLFTWLGAWYFLKETIKFVGNKNLPILDGHLWAIGLLLASLFSSIAIHQLYAECNRIGIQVRSAVSSLVYRKSLRLSRVRGGAGEVINLMTTDLTRMVDCIVNFHFFWSAFVECATIVAISFYEIGISAIPCLLFVVVFLPVQIYLGSVTATTARLQSKTTTERVHIMSEILTAVKLIKFYAWEKPFNAKIHGIRESEMSAIYRQMMIRTVNYAIVFAIPVLIALSSLGMYVSLGNTLTASVSFAVLSVFNTLRYPFFMLPLAVRGMSNAASSLSNLNDFLMSDEIIPITVLKHPEGSDDDTAFELKDCDFKWDGADGEKPTLRSISLKAKRGDKIAIIGDVGSGKSSLIAALLGQIRQVRGDALKIYGSTSYVPQEAWLLNTTLRDNITFGCEYKKRMYNEVVRVCGLQRDITLLVAGDMTEIAERGANLSGGQRQRSSLARAVYHDCDILLLDDPLSAVDQHVGSHIFNECFMQHLKEKTIVMSTHQLQYLEQMDWIVMCKDGEIEKQGTFKELSLCEPFLQLINGHDPKNHTADDDILLLNDKKFEVPEILPLEKQYSEAVIIETLPKRIVRAASDLNQLSISDRSQLSVRKNVQLNESTISSMIERNQLSVVRGNMPLARAITVNELSIHAMPVETLDVLAKAHGRLVHADKSTHPNIRSFKTYIKAAWGPLPTIAIFLFFFLDHCMRVGSDYWLQLWVAGYNGYSNAIYLGVYAGCCVIFAIGLFLRGYAFSKMALAKSKVLHDSIFYSIMRAPMSFFDSTPLGRILSAFSKHQLQVDETMPDLIMQALSYAPITLGALAVCAVVVPWNWVPIVALTILAGFVVKFGAEPETATKNLEAITKPPIYAHLTSSIEGLWSIRAYNAQGRFEAAILEKLDTNLQATFGMLMVKSFYALLLDILGSLVVYSTAALVIVYRNNENMESISGLALTNALQMLVFVQWTFRMVGESKAQMSSVGQLAYYGTNVESEAPADIPETKPSASWPDQGLVKFENVDLRYTEFGVKVLKNINFTVYPTEKIGIVGRTGSGKSTLLISLLRIVEACEGKMTIDGIDVSTLGLDDLRKNIAIIPQEPVLFKGTVRSNLDPFNASTDEQIWAALDSVHLGKKIREMSDKLESTVIENGKNFSLGQRQLFCIARAILSRTKVLVLDEATANVSPETDALIQTTIRENFEDVTVLTIAHRINTIIDCDRVLLLDAGEILEFDDPVTLLEKEGGSFKDLVDQTGPATAQRLYDMAREAQKTRVDKRPAGAKVEPIPTSPKGQTTIQELASSTPKQ